MPRPATVTASEILALVEKQDYRCALSGRALTPQTASLDHIQPLSRGGTHAIENLWVVDLHANAAKGTLTVDEFVALCIDVVRHRSILHTPDCGSSPAMCSSERPREQRVV